MDLTAARIIEGRARAVVHRCGKTPTPDPSPTPSLRSAQGRRGRGENYAAGEDAIGQITRHVAEIQVQRRDAEHLAPARS